MAKGQLDCTSWMVVFKVQGLCQINEEDNDYLKHSKNAKELIKDFIHELDTSISKIHMIYIYEFVDNF